MELNLTDRQINSIYDSWQVIVSDSERIGSMFYERLFQIQPELRVYFKSDLNSQVSKFMSTLTLLITKLHSGKSLAKDIQYLAQRHSSYGASPGHYELIGQVLLWTLENGLGEKWNVNLKSSWTLLYEKVAESMMHWTKITNDASRVA